MTNTWIFQGNPSIFDVDGYLQAMPGAITWLVRQNAKKMRVGDTVFIWRSQGKGSTDARSGVIASGEIVSPVTTMSDELESRPFWIEKSETGKAQARVWVKVDRVANKKEELKRDWLLADEVLGKMLILRQPAGTNFSLSAQEGERLRKMWSRVGQAWSRSESLAGLWAYTESYGAEVSELVTSPVGIVSKLTGRAISGVYNKVMNFLSIDPRDERQDMSGAGMTDRAVWNEFYEAETQVLDRQAIGAEFDRIWRTVAVDAIEFLPENNAEIEVFDGEVEKLLKRDIDELMAAYEKQQNIDKTRVGGRPNARAGWSIVFQRNPLIVAIAKIRAATHCETPGCIYEPFEDEKGDRYCEVHHIHPLSQGGSDTLNNVVCLCPTHHREAHLGKRSAELRDQFEQVRISS